VEPSIVKFVENNLLLFAVAVISGAMLLWPLVRRGTGGPWVSVAQATQLINREDAVMVDVRDQGEYEAGHILGARNLPLARLGGELPGELAKRKDKPLIVYDDGGERSAKAAAALRKQGFERVVNLTGGLGAWKQAGLPVEK
jgi:rhodanese-related sulfurtransferase